MPRIGPEIGQRVDRERPAGPGRGHDEGGDDRPDDLAEDELERVQADRVGQLVARHEAGQQRDDRRLGDGVGGVQREERGDEVDLAGEAPRSQDPQGLPRSEPATGRGHRRRPATVEAVGHDPARDREQEDRQEPSEVQDARPPTPSRSAGRRRPNRRRSATTSPGSRRTHPPSRRRTAGGGRVRGGRRRRWSRGASGGADDGFIGA